MKPADQKPAKKPYRRPKLTVYGDVRELTRTSNRGGTVNDMTTGMNKSR
jgi:hypothetical protein